jgi:hypothetical protein
VLRLWIQYNKSAIEASRGLCTVRTTAERVYGDALYEVSRIRDELVAECGVEGSAIKIEPVDEKFVAEWVDKKLLHEKAGGSEVRHAGLRGCEWPAWKSTADIDKQRQNDERMYEISMQVFCDLESGLAFEEGYEWPQNF